MTIRYVDETASTNADLVAAAAAGWPEGQWLRAERQTGGRGRQGRHWASPPGNLYISTLVRLRQDDPTSASLAFVAAVALDEAVRAHMPTTDTLTLKWPNDLLLDGRKLAGVLLQRVGDAVVVGMGINVAHRPDLPDRRAASLAEHGVVTGAGELAATLVETFAGVLECWRSVGVQPVLDRWLTRAHPVGTTLTARLPDGDVAGAFAGLDRDGALLLRLASGEQRVIHAGDVFLN